MKVFPSHMVIGDAHAKPGVNNERFTWAGNMAVVRRPDVIIDMGDWADMESLCSYDKGHKAFEGRRYTKDVEAARDARAKFLAPIKEHNRRYPKDKYNPRMIALGGNHCEGRILRAMELQPELDGLISVGDLGAAEFGWEYVPFLHPITVDGVTYAHYFISGVMGKPIGGKYPARSLVNAMHQSVTAAHSHVFDFDLQTCADGRKLCGLVAGCFFEHRERYAGRANGLWWRGIVMCNHVNNGFYDLEQVRVQEVKRLYS